jgi:DNA-binding XRE family transcriptional regulator
MHEHGFLKLRKLMGLTQAQMASLIRVPLLTVRAREAGTLEIKSKRLIRQKRRGRLS